MSMYWRVCLDSLPGHIAASDPRVEREASPRGWAKSFTNPLRLALAPASPLVGEEGDQTETGVRHA